MKYLLCLLCIVSSLVSLEKIEDLSDLALLHPDFSERKTAKVRLKNGLSALLISDPKSDLSAAALCVKAGSWNDPQEYPGMAHFCEHMLFMGTKKYPEENIFFSEIANYGGSTNAFTALDRTVYMFSSQPTGFLPLLDQFAHFFIDPLFHTSNIAREMHAVDQEFSKAIENDSWRSYMVFKEMSREGHPHQLFSCGNSETLSHIPQSTLRSWMEANYSADKMHLVISSSLPLADLEEAILAFEEVPIAIGENTQEIFPISSKEQIGHITYIEPIQHRQLLTLSWELPPSLSADPSQPADLIAYALQRGHDKSLNEALKKEGFIDDFLVNIDDLGGKNHRFFEVHFELTDRGLEEMETVIAYAMETLALYQKTGVPRYLFEEKNKMKKLGFEYQSREDPMNTARKIAATLPDEELSTFPKNTLLATHYNPEKLKETLAFLSRDNLSITLLAPLEKRGISPKLQEKWMKVSYTYEPLSSLKRSTRKKIEGEIAIAPPNPFSPKLLARGNGGKDEIPSLLSESAMGKAYFAKDTDLPEVNIHLHILSSLMDASLNSEVLQDLYLDHLTDTLHPTLEAASQANLQVGFEKKRGKFHIQISGFSEKALLLLQKIAKEMPKNPPTKEAFSLYVARHKKSYLNKQKRLAYLQGKELLDSLLLSYKTTAKEKLQILENLSYEAFLDFHKNLFKSTYLEALFTGDLSIKEAQNAWVDTVYTLGKSPFPREKHPCISSYSIPPSGPFSLSLSTEMQGNATLLLIDQGECTFTSRGAQTLLGTALEEAFFHELRTKQKTGYIAASLPLELEGKLFTLFLVQSNSHLPEELLYRFELFLETYLQELERNISEERFAMMKKSAGETLKSAGRSLKEKGNLWDLFAFEKESDFSYLEKRIEALEALSYPSFLEVARNWIERKNRKRLAIFVEGRIPNPFSFHLTGKSEFITHTNREK